MIPKLNRWVTIERPTGVDDGAGGRSGGFIEETRLFAAVELMRGRAEDVAGAYAESVTPGQVTIRRRAVRAGWRVRWSGQTADVRAVRDDGGRYLVLDVLVSAD